MNLNFRSNVLCLSILSIFVQNPRAVAAPKPVCDSKAVTRNCEYFRERKSQSEIGLSDGSTFRNPAYEKPKDEEKKSTEVPKPLDEENDPRKAEREKFIELQADALDLMASTNFSNRFKLSFINSISAADNKHTTIEVPWPAEDPRASKKKMPLTEVEAFIKGRMRAEDFTSLNKSLSELRKPHLDEVSRIQEEQMDELIADKTKAESEALSIAQRDKKKARIKDFFVYAKDQIIETISRGKRPDQLTAEEKAMIERVKIITLAEMDTEELKNEPTCADNAVNAYYATKKHSINICPGQIMQPDGDVLFTIAHEIGHSIDPCLSAQPMWQVDEKKIKELQDSKRFTEQQKTDFGQFFTKGQSLLIADFHIYTQDDSMVKEAIQRGAIKKIDSGVKKESYPFKDEYSCFVNKLGFVETTPRDIEESKVYLNSRFRDQPLEKGQLERYVQAVKAYPQCLTTIGPESKMGETISDMFGALIVEKFMLENPDLNEDEKVGAFVFAHKACRKDAGSFKVGKAASSLQAVFRGNFKEPHPLSDMRVKGVLLNLPGIADRYNCVRKVPSCFDHLSASKRMRLKSSATSVTEGRK